MINRSYFKNNTITMENESTIWKISYINIQWWMIYNLWLSWNELLLYALIHWYTQDWKNEYHWSLTYIQNWLLLSRPTVISLLQKLQEKWLIVQTKESHYIASKESLLLVKKLYHTSKETLPVTSKETLPNIYNTINNNNNSSLSSNEDSSLVSDTLQNNDIIVKIDNKINSDIVKIDNNKDTCSNKKEKNKIKKDEIENRDALFENLWDWYCKQNTKKQTEMKQARVYFDKLIKTNYDLDLLRYALPRYISSITNKQYLVLLRTYLSKESYLDYKSEFDNLNKPKEVKVEDIKEFKENNAELKFKRTYEN